MLSRTLRKFLLLGGMAGITAFTVTACGGTDPHGYQVPPTVTPFPSVKLPAPTPQVTQAPAATPSPQASAPAKPAAAPSPVATGTVRP